MAVEMGGGWPLLLLVLWAMCASMVCAKTVSVEKMLKGLEKYQESYPLPTLPFKYNELEPYIDEHTLKEHHMGIHAKYTLQMNKDLKEWRASNETSELAKSSILDIMKNLKDVPDKWRHSLGNNIGGYLNHIFYFATLSPNPTGEKRDPSKTKQMSRAFEHSFGTFEQFKKNFNNSMKEIFSTGFVWLVRVPKYRYLTIYYTVQESSPISVNYEPLVGLDLWEHAHFSKYGNNRNEYIDNWWKVIDWDKVEDVINWWWQFEPKHDEL